MLNSNQINIIQNKQLKEELIKYNQVIEEFLKNTNNNNTNLIDNFLTQSFIEFGSYATYGHSNRIVITSYSIHYTKLYEYFLKTPQLPDYTLSVPLLVVYFE